MHYADPDPVRSSLKSGTCQRRCRCERTCTRPNAPLFYRWNFQSTTESLESVNSNMTLM
jgi:hypothetical protein